MCGLLLRSSLERQDHQYDQLSAHTADWGRTSAPASVNLSQCSVTDFPGIDKNVLGGLQQAETAVQMDQVCKYTGGCSFVIGMLMVPAGRPFLRL